MKIVRQETTNKGKEFQLVAIQDLYLIIGHDSEGNIFLGEIYSALEDAQDRFNEVIK